MLTFIFSHASTNLLDMVRDQASPVRGVLVDSKPIVGTQLARAGHGITKLPKRIRSHTGILQPQAGRLPLALHRAVVRSSRRTILLQQTGLLGLLAHSSVSCDPRITPIVGGAPRTRVEMHRAKGNVWQGNVGGEVETLNVRVGVGAVAIESEALVANGDHAVSVERADVVGRGADPVCEHGGVARVAARLVGELPREDCGRSAVAGDNGFDVCLVHGLALGRLVPLGVAGDAARGEVRCHAAVVGPIIYEVDDQLDAVLLGGFDHGVEALQAIGAGVDGRCGARKGLKVHCAGTGNCSNVVEAPYTEDLQFFLGDVVHDDINIVVVGEKGDPVAVGAGVVCMGSVPNSVTATTNLHLTLPSMLNFEPSALGWEARAVRSFFAAGSAATAATIERIVASFMVTCSKIVVLLGRGKESTDFIWIKHLRCSASLRLDGDPSPFQNGFVHRWQMKGLRRCGLAIVQIS